MSATEQRLENAAQHTTVRPRPQMLQPTADEIDELLSAMAELQTEVNDIRTTVTANQEELDKQHKQHQNQNKQLNKISKQFRKQEKQFHEQRAEAIELRATCKQQQQRRTALASEIAGMMVYHERAQDALALRGLLEQGQDKLLAAVKTNEDDDEDTVELIQRVRASSPDELDLWVLDKVSEDIDTRPTRSEAQEAISREGLSTVDKNNYKELFRLVSDDRKKSPVLLFCPPLTVYSS
ncbi:hypothetical protein PHYPSEUDO_011151 [Phytophthora pseudosyringae]|uniref:Uncharacterized protein n=1 Tax=Phytophthora pseudosyringae TaxID=221518 RepID=A0A8T1VC30_9STRA|nr:hypothetical protein PHYPSEUDO_011151 [Phytophthora pseudosyringae]